MSTPEALQNFQVRPGLEGPQAICTWDPPLAAIDGYCIVRKLGEYPRDKTDGVVLVENTLTPMTAGTFADRGTDLLPVDAEDGDSQWWYYSAFVRPSLPPLAEQFGGLGFQEIDTDTSSGFTEPLLLEDYQDFDIQMTLTEGAACTFLVQVSNLYSGPWAPAGSLPSAALGVPQSMWLAGFNARYIRVGVVGVGRTFEILFTVPRDNYPWMTLPEMSRPCLVFKTGRHMKAAWEGGHWPGLYRLRDVEQIAYLYQSTSSLEEEAFNLGRTNDPRGAMYRYLWILLLEFDRTHAYLKAALEYDSNIELCPPERLKHIAFALGWPLDTEIPYEQARAELSRVPGVWKQKGTPKLTELLVIHELGVVPRVQEGPGLVATFANPDLFR